MWTTIWIVTESYKYNNHSVAYGNHDEAVKHALHIIDKSDEKVLHQYSGESKQVWRLEKAIVTVTKQELFVV